MLAYQFVKNELSSAVYAFETPNKDDGLYLSLKIKEILSKKFTLKTRNKIDFSKLSKREADVLRQLDEINRSMTQEYYDGDTEVTVADLSQFKDKKIIIRYIGKKYKQDIEKLDERIKLERAREKEKRDQEETNQF